MNKKIASKNKKLNECFTTPCRVRSILLNLLIIRKSIKQRKN
jgi:hypothetical protein